MALERFIPQTPDPYIKNDKSQGAVKFGHLNALVDAINSTIYGDYLQLQGVGPMSTTLRALEDPDGNLAQLYLATNKTAISGSLKIGGTTGNLSSAILQIDSTTQGVLFPRVTQAERDAIASPAIGLLVFNTDTNQVNAWNGSSWVPGGFLHVDEVYSNAVQLVAGITPKSTYTNAGLVLQPNGTGAIMTSIPDGTNGGNARGQYAVDLQMSRNPAKPHQVASGNYSSIIGGSNNIASGNHSISGGSYCDALGANSVAFGYSNTASGGQSVVCGGYINTASGSESGLVSGRENEASGQRSFIGGGYLNVNSSSGGVISGGQSNTASTNTHATVVGGQSNTSSGGWSISGGYTNVASGAFSIALGNQNIASGQSAVALGHSNSATGTNSTTIGYGNSVTYQNGTAIGTSNTVGNKGAAIGGSNTISSGEWSSTIGSANSITSSGNSYAIADRAVNTASYGFSTGLNPKNYLQGSHVHANGWFTLNRGDKQITNCIASKEDTLTTGGTTVLSLDGTGTTNLIIPDGNNRAWNVKVESVATVTSITGTATGVSVGDTFMQDDKLLFKRVSGTSSVVGATNQTLIADTSMGTASITYSAGASQELAITFTAPTFAGGGSVTCRVVSKVSLVEVAY